MKKNMLSVAKKCENFRTADPKYVKVKNPRKALGNVWFLRELILLQDIGKLFQS